MKDFQTILKKENKDEINDLKEIFEYIDKNEYSFGLLFSLDGVFFNEVEEVKKKLNEKNFIEARFFNKKKELFVFYDGENYKAVKTDRDKWDKDIIEREYILDKKFKEYTKVKVKEFIAYDEDGQAYVKASCLDGVE